MTEADTEGGSPRVLLGLEDAAEQLISLSENRLRLQRGPDSEDSNEESEDDGAAEEIPQEAIDPTVSDEPIVSAERWLELENLGHDQVLNFTNGNDIKVELSRTGVGEPVLQLENVLVPEAKRGQGVFRRLLSECEAYCIRMGMALR